MAGLVSVIALHLNLLAGESTTQIVSCPVTKSRLTRPGTSDSNAAVLNSPNAAAL